MDEKSTRQGRPGPEPLSAERDFYRQLMAQGMGNSQAWREIGINRRTGTRWRYGRIVDTRDGRAAHHYPPITRPRPAVIPGGHPRPIIRGSRDNSQLSTPCRPLKDDDLSGGKHGLAG